MAWWVVLLIALGAFCVGGLIAIIATALYFAKGMQW